MSSLSNDNNSNVQQQHQKELVINTNSKPYPIISTTLARKKKQNPTPRLNNYMAATKSQTLGGILLFIYSYFITIII